MNTKINTKIKCLIQLGANSTPPEQVVTDAMLTSDEGVSFYFASSDIGEENVYLQLS